jgi:hypothetical protein
LIDIYECWKLQGLQAADELSALFSVVYCRAPEGPLPALAVDVHKKHVWLCGAHWKRECLFTVCWCHILAHLAARVSLGKSRCAPIPAFLWLPPPPQILSRLSLNHHLRLNPLYMQNRALSIPSHTRAHTKLKSIRYAARQCRADRQEGGSQHHWVEIRSTNLVRKWRKQLEEDKFFIDRDALIKCFCWKILILSGDSWFGGGLADFSQNH